MLDGQYDLIVASIYRAGQGEGQWGEVLESLVTFLHCWSAHLMGFDVSSGAMMFGHEAGAPPAEATLDYIRFWHRKDPRNAVLLTAPPETWVHCHEHLSESFVSHNDFYQQFLIPYGSRYVSGMHFAPSTELTCILSFQRGVAQQPFSLEERRVIERFGKHVRAAFLLQAQARQILRQSVAGYAVLQRLYYPVLLIDGQRNIIYENAAAKQYLSTAKVVGRRGGNLSLNNQEANVELTVIISALAKGEEHPYKTFLTLRRAEEPPVVLHLALLRPDETMKAFGKLPLFLVTLFPSSNTAKLDPYLIGNAFSLTPAESRVAVAVAEGRSDTEVAEVLGTAASTVRSQIRSVFSKVGVSKRSSLVRLLNGSPAFWRAGM
jgi:DNA-binding CsgD family transcriptional regulator